MLHMKDCGFGATNSYFLSGDGQMRFRMERNEKLVIRDSAYCVPFVTRAGQNEDTAWVKKMRKNLRNAQESPAVSSSRNSDED